MFKQAGRLAVIACLAASLQGCFFVFIPGSVMAAASDKITGSEGDHCVAESAKVGDRITINGQNYTVKSLSGTSTRCQQAIYPIRALLTPEANLAGR